MYKSSLTVGLALICFAGICLVTSHETLPRAHAQSKGKKPGNVKMLDVRALNCKPTFPETRIRWHAIMKMRATWRKRGRFTSCCRG